MRIPSLFVLLLPTFVLACPTTEKPDDTGEPPGIVDADQDGYTAEADCDDQSALVHPGASETCNGVDDNCDELVDDADPLLADATTTYADADGDGYGDASAGTTACTPPEGNIVDGSDCDDTDAAVNPLASETCDDVDNNCNGAVDEGAKVLRYPDVDGDGYGALSGATSVCDGEPGWVAISGDCDDTLVDTHPGAEETCDGEDQDCDGGVDDNAVGAPTWYADRDGDSYGDATSTKAACTQPYGYVADATDCDDDHASNYPAATEYCDGMDNDCDAVVDEDDAADAPTWYYDGDGDGYGDAAVTDVSCAWLTDFVRNATDCDDTNADIRPTATEYCDGIDTDCDGTLDESSATGASNWFRDADGDGYGDPSSVTRDCYQPSGYITDYSDCDDTDPLSFPGGIETCDAEDNDCDGVIDNDTGAVTWYRDADGDTYGNPLSTTENCAWPAGYVSDYTDCDDGRATAWPGAPETCNSLDDDCDYTTDEDAIDAPTWYQDSDNDGYGDVGSTAAACSPPVGYLADATDCDDRSLAIHPGAEETCNEVDDDCDGDLDEGAIDALTFYLDADADSFGDASVSLAACAAPTGYVPDGTDCDDTTDLASPVLTEVCGDGLDNDCDGTGNTCDLLGLLDATEADAVLYTTDGIALSTAAPGGDLNGDGYEELLVGSAGNAYVAMGPLTGEIDLSPSLFGTDLAGKYGTSVAGARDIDGGGMADFLVGAPATSLYNSGDGTAELVVDGASTALLFGDAASAALGTSVAMLDDVDGDHLVDLFVGAKGVKAGGTSAGAAYLFSGGVSGEISAADASATLVGEVAYDYAGTTVAGAGDLNGDGLVDLLVGAPTNDDGGTSAGAAYVVYGPVSGSLDLSMADAILTGDGSYDQAGTSLAGAGDTNGDGYDDLLVGAPYYGATSTVTPGEVGLFLGPVADATIGAAAAVFSSGNPEALVGSSVAGPGDLNLDGLDDVMVAAACANNFGECAGEAYLFRSPASGALDTSEADLVLTVGEPWNLGASLGASDLSGDGLPDLFVVAPDGEYGGAVTGLVYVFTASTM